MPPLVTLISLPLYAIFIGPVDAKAQIGPTLLAIGVGVILWVCMFLVGICRSAASIDLEREEAETTANETAEEIRRNIEEERQHLKASSVTDAKRDITLHLFNRLLDSGKQLEERLRTELHPGTLYTTTIEQCAVEAEAWRLSVNLLLDKDHLEVEIEAFVPTKERNEILAKLNDGISKVENARASFLEQRN
ncbi:MAG: hypothetical protein IH984_07460 [Planctomycetes bacterium]|nr:hypothetical protein [Planctomycetota bacterium]